MSMKLFALSIITSKNWETFTISLPKQLVDNLNMFIMLSTMQTFTFSNAFLDVTFRKKLQMLTLLLLCIVNGGNLHHTLNRDVSMTHLFQVFIKVPIFFICKHSTLTFHSTGKRHKSLCLLYQHQCHGPEHWCRWVPFQFPHGSEATLELVHLL